MIQLRLKEESARSLVEVARSIQAMVPDVPLVVNDRADVALAAGAAGVHVGVDDLAPALLRRVVPPGFIIGASVGSDDEVARAAGADYVGIGPVYGTGRRRMRARRSVPLDSPSSRDAVRCRRWRSAASRANAWPR